MLSTQLYIFLLVCFQIISPFNYGRNHGLLPLNTYLYVNDFKVLRFISSCDIYVRITNNRYYISLLEWSSIASGCINHCGNESLNGHMWASLWSVSSAFRYAHAFVCRCVQQVLSPVGYSLLTFMSVAACLPNVFVSPELMEVTGVSRCKKMLVIENSRIKTGGRCHGHQ
jgi:hypothetical protein